MVILMLDRKRLIPGLVGMLLMGACAGARAASTPAETSPVQVTQGAESEPESSGAGAPASTSLSRQSPLYRLEPGDTLTVEVYPDKDYKRDVVIDEGGSVHLPLVGTVQWAGRTVAEARDQLDGLLRGKYYLDPRVMISVAEFRSAAERVYVFGQVKNPGAYNYKQGITLLRALALAGGFTDVAKDQSVELLRKRSSERQREKRERVDINDVIRGKIPDPILEPDDVVVVPESFF